MLEQYPWQLMESPVHGSGITLKAFLAAEACQSALVSNRFEWWDVLDGLVLRASAKPWLSPSLYRWNSHTPYKPPYVNLYL